MAKRYCVCDSCGMEFEINRLDKESDTMKDGHEVEVLSFTCPKCDEKYVVTVRDSESARLQKEYQFAQESYRKSYNKEDPMNLEVSRVAKREMEFKKKVLGVYMSKLKKKCLKELRRRGQ